MLTTTKIVWGLLTVVCIVESSVFKKNVYVNEGNTFILPCRNETPGNFFALVWQSTTVMPHKSSIFDYFSDTGYNVHDSIVKRSKLVQQTSLQIDDARATDTGSYECNIIYVSSKSYKVVLKSIITLVVSSTPNITSLTPLSQIKTIGERPLITCKVNATPNATITWKRNDGKPIRGRIVTNGMTSVLKMKRLKMSDTAYYTCTAENRAGKIGKTAFLKVKTIPKIESLSVPRINVDASGKLTCKAVGYPIPLVEWYISGVNNGEPLTSGRAYLQKYRVSKTVTDEISEVAENSLYIYSATVQDWKKNYTCLAANSEGSATRVVNITGFDKPGRPRIINVTTFSNYVIVQWTTPPDGGSKILAYVVEYKNVNQIEWMSREIRPANVDRFKIMDLRPNTIYSFRIYAKNMVGMSQHSRELTTNTKGISHNQVKAKTEPSNKVDDNDTATGKSSNAQKSKNGILGSFGITALIGIFAGAFLALAIFGVVVFFLFRKLQKTSQEQTASIPGSRPISMENGSLAPGESRRPSAMPSETSEMIPLMTRADQWEFPRDRLRLSTVLGTGAFGMVMRGDALGIRGSIGNVKCAVKMVKDSDNECARKDLYAELDMLKLVPEHPNVVSLLGCCTRTEPLMIIVEYCANGDLQGFLRSSRGISERYYRERYGESPPPKITAKTLLSFAWQIATGMNHLATFKVIHRDLAARNILVDENLVCKISDFGFARDIYVEDQYLKKSQGGRFPIKWMAIESLLDGISTSKSDVWSFAVVLWEIVTLGASPYPGMNSYEVVSFLQDGYRMDKPKHCSDDVYAVLMECWHVSSQRRPTFEEIADKFRGMIDCDDQEFINMNFYQDHLYVNFDVNLATQSSNNASAQELTMTDSTPLTAGSS